MTYFSENKSIDVFFICETETIPEEKESEDIKLYYNKYNIQYLGSVTSFSLSSPLLALKSIRIINKFIQNYKIELFHVLMSTPYAVWCNFVKVPYIITTRGSDALINIPSLKSGGLKNKIWLYLYKRAFANAFKVTSTSFGQIKKLRSVFGDFNNQVMIRTGIDIENIEKSSGYHNLDKKLTPKKFVFAPRHFTRIHNPELIVDSVPFISTQILRQYYFVFISAKYPESNYLKKMHTKLEEAQKKYGLKYIVLQHIEQNVMWEYFNNASLAVLTPISDGTPNTALEAMALKCPLIVANLNYDEDLFTKTCLKLKSYNPDELGELINYALNDYPVSLLENAKEKVSILGNKKIEMEKLKSIYLSVSSNK